MIHTVSQLTVLILCAVMFKSKCLLQFEHENWHFVKLDVGRVITWG
jgi:hypothetical protein